MQSITTCVFPSPAKGVFFLSLCFVIRLLCRSPVAHDQRFGTACRHAKNISLYHPSQNLR